MENLLVLSVVISGENIMRNPLLKATGIVLVDDKPQVVEIDTPITSVTDFIEAFKGLFEERK